MFQYQRVLSFGGHCSRLGAICLLVALSLPAASAQAANNPLAAFFSIFEKKEKSRSAPVIIVPKKPRAPVPGGKRILNPFITSPGGRPAQEQKPKTFNVGRRTMCVRLCDGYYWPMKRGGTNNSLMTDSQRCESQCTSKARLFVLRSSTDDIAGMRDLRGKPYSSLKNAFAYRKTFNPSCRCTPEPWSERARLRHARYAAVGKERKVLAIRAIRMDLRSTLQPERDPPVIVSALFSSSPVPETPALPTRTPGRVVVAAQVTNGARESVATPPGHVVETSAIAAPRYSSAHGSAQRAPIMSFRPGRQRWSQAQTGRPDVRVPVLTGARAIQSRRPTRSVVSHVQSRLPAPLPLRSAYVPVALQLRPRLD